MTNVIPFKKPDLSKKHKQKTLCRHGFHKWKILNQRKFDVKQGRLVTVYECIRCQEKKVKAL